MSFDRFLSRWCPLIMNASGTFSLKISKDSKASMALYKVDNDKKEPSGWQSLSEELLLQCVTALVKLAEQDKSQKDSFLVVRSYAALLCVSRYWRKVAFKVSLQVDYKFFPTFGTKS